MKSQNTPASIEPEQLLKIHDTATALGVPYWQLQRAIRLRIVPSYAPFNGRRLVYLSELKNFVQSSRKGGHNV